MELKNHWPGSESLNLCWRHFMLFRNEDDGRIVADIAITSDGICGDLDTLLLTEAEVLRLDSISVAFDPVDRQDDGCGL